MYLLKDLGARDIGKKEAAMWMKRLDRNEDGQLGRDELLDAVLTFIKEQHAAVAREKSIANLGVTLGGEQGGVLGIPNLGIAEFFTGVTSNAKQILEFTATAWDGGFSPTKKPRPAPDEVVAEPEPEPEEEGEDDEDLEVPEDLVHLSPDQQQVAILKRAFSMMGMGTALVRASDRPSECHLSASECHLSAHLECHLSASECLIWSPMASECAGAHLLRPDGRGPGRHCRTLR